MGHIGNFFWGCDSDTSPIPKRVEDKSVLSTVVSRSAQFIRVVVFPQGNQNFVLPIGGVREPIDRVSST
jgi:hypothetical protein